MPQSSIRAKKKTPLPLSELVDVLAELKTGKFFFFCLQPLYTSITLIFSLFPLCLLRWVFFCCRRTERGEET